MPFRYTRCLLNKSKNVLTGNNNISTLEARLCIFSGKINAKNFVCFSLNVFVDF